MKIHRMTILVLLAGVAAFHFNIERAQARAATDVVPQEVLNIPARVGPYTQDGADSEVSDRVRELLQTSLIIERTYRDRTRFPISLSVVHSGTTRRSLHFPEVCIVGAGFEVREQSTMPIGFEFTATKLIIAKDGYQQAVLYWFKTGNEVTGNFFTNSWNWAKTQLTFGAPTSSLIKISAPIIGSNEDRVFSLLEDFALKLHPELMKSLE